ncbi:radical SAM family heme chaperone HemW, partial [Myxococcota bacterium]|nr:radical SAM family heme chaperone HemW [Myxococcota bacterium]
MPRPHHPHHPFGIYLHIPYCASLCPYCDFNSYHSEDPPWAALTQAILNDLAFHAPRFENGELVSIYFGGGTPSLAPPEMIAALIKEISSRFEASPKEITLEANPGTVDNHKIKAFRDAGINRMSFGWQSTHDKTLKLLGRTHTADDGRAALLMARAAGFENLTLDLIFATPGQTIRELEEDLDALIELEPEHISLYALTYHSGTPFYEWRKRGKFRPIEVEVEVEMMELIDERLVREGFEHYEVSNYAQKPKNLRTSLFRARHNSLYWQGAPYLGLGPGAHSFWRDGAIAGQRWAALKKPEDYIAAYNKTLKLETV